MHRAGTHPLVPLVVYSRVADASAACRDNRAYDRLDHQACADGRQQALEEPAAETVPRS